MIIYIYISKIIQIMGVESFSVYSEISAAFQLVFSIVSGRYSNFLKSSII